MENNANKFLLNPVKKLNDANQELYRPEEDMVTFLVCKNSQMAIENYLRGFLIKNEVDTSELNTVESLYEQCLLINKGFKKINLSEFNCKAIDTTTKFCNDQEKVSKCFDIANNLDTFLKQQKII